MFGLAALAVGVVAVTDACSTPADRADSDHPPIELRIDELGVANDLGDRLP